MCFDTNVFNTRKNMEDKKKKPYRILALDGGGIRGIIPATIIKEIEARTGKRIHELFDLVAGTSTGGILALGLTLPLKNAKPYSGVELLDLYSTRGNEIFPKLGLWSRMLNPKGAFEEKYNQAGIEQVLREYFQDVKLSQTLPGVEVLITAYEIEKRKPWFFKSNRAKQEKERDFLAWEVARSTSAAPTYFEPHKLDTGESEYWALVDGGVFANNPTMCAYAEAKMILGNIRQREKEAAEREIVERGMEEKIEARDGDNQDYLVVSIGTGTATKRFPYGTAKDWGALGWLEPLISILMQGASESVDYQMRQLLPDSTDKTQHYFRFQVELSEDKEDMADVSPENIQFLKGISQSLMETQSNDMDKLCAQLMAFS